MVYIFSPFLKLDGHLFFVSGPILFDAVLFKMCYP